MIEEIKNKVKELWEKHYHCVIDESFRGKNRVQQQRIVYSALKGKMDGSKGELHALALTTKVPEG